MNYRRVTHEDRLVIKTCLDLGLTQSEIAVKTDFDQSMISREINRNRGSRGYKPRQAARRAMERQSYRMLPRKMRGKTLERIEENRIGVLRRYIPKDTDVSKLHWKKFKKIELEINKTPMKCFDWKTPYEVMMKKSCTAFV